MPAYNFKDQFVPMIEGGRKLTTIRQVRKKRPTRVGDRLFLFNRMRQSKCRLIKDTECVAVTPIEIFASRMTGRVRLNGADLNGHDIARLAERDGFQEINDFLDFFLKNYGPHFVGELIEWIP